jgi:hypothetical protein
MELRKAVAERAVDVFKFLTGKMEKEIHEGRIKITPPHPGHFCVRILFPDAPHDRVNALSLSAVKIIEWSDPNTTTIEIALFKGEDLVYVDDIGYDDVCIFDDEEDLLEEVKRLQEIVMKPV